MLISTQAIVLSKLKYKDNDLIIKCYTQQLGTVSYLVRGVFKSKKGLQKTAYYQLLSQIKIETHHKENKSLQYIKDVRAQVIYNTIHTHIAKSAVVMFLSEVLTHVLKEEEKNETLYKFIENALLWLDVENNFSNFHLLFLLKLTKHLGFYPDTSNNHLNYFNLQEGGFQEHKSKHTISGKNLTVLKLMLGINFDTLSTIKINASQRQDLLKIMLLYYELHIESFKQPKSLGVFNQVFN